MRVDRQNQTAVVAHECDAQRQAAATLQRVSINPGAIPVPRVKHRLFLSKEKRVQPGMAAKRQSNLR